MAVAHAPRPNRDSVTTIRDDGSRQFLYPADAYGRYATARKWSAAALIAIYVLLPWIPINGYPAVFLDLANRRFHLFGATLAAQDLWLLFFLITGLGFSLYYVTSLFGRVWCGWACPQTVFLDHVFRRIERLIDGDAVQRRKLEAQPWAGEKAGKRVLKHGLFLAVSFAITHLFLSYFVSLPALWAMMRQSPLEHWSAFLFILVATGILYFNFAWFREQLCIIICPYGRLQSALIDDNSMVVGYDAKRGEPRGKASDPQAGACIDCSRCVNVCPTGIDIRQGLQIECIACTACIDACDEVMDKLGRPRGLVRYDSLNGLNGKTTRLVRPRTIVYTLLLFVGAAVLTWALSTVRPANLGVTRMVGAPYFVDNGYVRNQFMMRVVNKSDATRQFRLEVAGAPRGVLLSGAGELFPVEGMGETLRPVVIQTPVQLWKGPFKLEVRLTDEQGSFDVVKTCEVIGPDPFLLKNTGVPNGR
jgi:cytochrome c oxidase accessory protein FixG